MCDKEKKVCLDETKISLAYGTPFPLAEITIKSYMHDHDGVVYHMCKDCRMAVLRVIADSKVASIENVRKEKVTE